MKRFFRSWGIALRHPFLFFYEAIPVVITSIVAFVAIKLLLRGDLLSIIRRISGWCEAIAGFSLLSKSFLFLAFVILVLLFFDYYNVGLAYLADNARSGLKIRIRSGWQAVGEHGYKARRHFFQQIRAISMLLVVLFALTKLLGSFITIGYLQVVILVAALFFGPTTCSTILLTNIFLDKSLMNWQVPASFRDWLSYFGVFGALSLLGCGIFGALQSTFYHSARSLLPVVPSFVKTLVPSLVVLKQIFSVITHRKEYLYLTLGLGALFISFVVFLIVVWHVYVIDRMNYRLAKKNNT